MALECQETADIQISLLALTLRMHGIQGAVAAVNVVRRLKERAGAHGVSMEEEHRQILREALIGTPTKHRSFKDLLLAMPGVGDDADFARDPQRERHVEL